MSAADFIEGLTGAILIIGTFAFSLAFVAAVGQLAEYFARKDEL